MDIICFCHLRWNFVYQRPQHLMTRFSQKFRVFIIEEPIMDSTEKNRLEIYVGADNLWVITPHLTDGLSEKEIIAKQQFLLQEWFKSRDIQHFILWYYTPMAIPLGESLPRPDLTIYDCMDELSAFKDAPPAIREYEQLLFKKADLVFTGGYHLYEVKKDLHPHVYPFPSSIDKKHFSQARTIIDEPQDQLSIPHPRIGFFGVIDERLDIDLIRQLSTLQPGWHFVLIGPVVKIDPASLPAAPNIHYTGSRPYQQLPAYLSSWDVALIPFALNESTQFISPTKTPEYLAGGIPVVSAPIRDVVKPYGEMNLVYIADSAKTFIQGIEWGLEIKKDPGWLKSVDDFLVDNSWDITWLKMMLIIQKKLYREFPDPLIKIENEYV